MEDLMRPRIELKVHNSLRLIIANKDQKALNYAVNYARAGLSMTGEELRVQCLYVLNNITHWRGEVAKEVRGVLKEYTNRNH
uniref:Uncharacterized protein n=2 Tax=viral metagenome TaxID=1070528 RepID=A0A6H2A6A0_9ZZZZ